MYENFILLGISYISGIIVPGPSLYQILRASLIYGRTIGLYSALGVVMGIGLQTIVVLNAVHFLTNNALNLLKLLSGCFLVVLSLMILFKGKDINNKKLKDINKVKGSFFIQGLIIEVLNPLAFGFLVSILSLSDISNSSFILKIFYLIELLLLGLIWFGSIAFFATFKAFSDIFSKFSFQLEKLAGTVLLCFGLSAIKSFF